MIWSFIWQFQIIFNLKKLNFWKYFTENIFKKEVYWLAFNITQYYHYIETKKLVIIHTYILFSDLKKKLNTFLIFVELSILIKIHNHEQTLVAPTKHASLHERNYLIRFILRRIFGRVPFYAPTNMFFVSSIDFVNRN